MKQIQVTKMNHIDIKQIDCATHVYIDGHEIHGVRDIAYKQSVNSTPVLILEIMADVDISDVKSLVALTKTN